MYLLYSALLAVGMALATPFWLWQMLRHGKYRIGFGERWGRVPERIKQSSQPAIWIHAVSVGEVFAVSGLIEQLRKRFPSKRVVISTTTDSGQKLARERFGAESVFYFPLDFAFAIRAYLKYLRPELVVLAETEFWPNFLRLSRQSGARVAVVNARISDHSLPGYRRFRALLTRALRGIDLILAQTEEDRKRLIEIGAPEEHVRVSGNLKFDIPAPDPPAIVDTMRTAIQNASPTIVCGSTVEGEEPILLDAFATVLVTHASAVMILAPRHPERFGAIAELLQQRQVRFWRRSQWKGEPLAGGVFLLDSIGELAAMYAVADLAFVGGSLVPRGGHNILEPARHAIAILVGPHTENFRGIVELFRTNHAVRITSPEKLASDWMELISDPVKRAKLGRAAENTLHDQLGATERTLQALEQLLAKR